MKDKLKAFWAPMRDEFNKEHAIINIIGALGFIPAEYLSREIGGSFWLFMILIITWWALVVLIFLTYRYLKSEQI